MPWTSAHISWLKKTTRKIKTSDGIAVEVWEFRHQPDDQILKAWAKHFRNHYCRDNEIDSLRVIPTQSRKQYLVDIKFPDKNTPPGPSVRSGDFGEILVADYLQYKLGTWVPRTRYGSKDVRNESTKGADVIGFKVLSDRRDSVRDTLFVYEAKAQFTGNAPLQRLQDAIEGSAKDEVRKAESLNSIKQHFVVRQQNAEKRRIERFQNPADRPFKEERGAVALFSTSLLDAKEIAKADATKHPRRKNLALIVIHGKDMMDLVHELYEKAASEA